MQTMTAGKPAGCISALDQQRLETLIERTFGRERPLNPAASLVLQRLRNAAAIARPELIPPGVVTMNSEVRLVDEASGRAWGVIVVYPEDHDPQESCWSVLHPVGAALFGRCVGDLVAIPGDDGATAHWRVVDVPFQPEARGFLTM